MWPCGGIGVAAEVLCRRWTLVSLVSPPCSASNAPTHPPSRLLLGDTQIASLRAQIRKLEASLVEARGGGDSPDARFSMDSFEGLPMDATTRPGRDDSGSPRSPSRFSGSSRSSGSHRLSGERHYVSHPILFNHNEDGSVKTEEDLVCIKRADLELLYLKERAMDLAHEGITIADVSMPDMPLIYINDGFRRITGYPVGAVKNKNCRFLQGEGTDQKSVTKLRNAIKSGKPCTVQLMNYRKDGSRFVNNLSVTPIHDEEGKLTHFVGVQSDVTELVQRKQAIVEAKLEAAQAAVESEAKSKFLTRMSHEIRTPLNGIIAVSELLSCTDLTPQQWDLVNTIKCSGDALLSLITDILDFGKIEANKMTLTLVSFHLRSTVEAAMEISGMLASQKRLHVGYTIADDVPEVIHADPDRLQQVLLNILNNAVKFTESGEVLLEISTRPFADDDRDGAVGAVDDDGNPPTQSTRTYPVPSDRETCLHFRVTDTGIGMSSAGIRLLFQSFSQIDNTVSTRKYGGSGLGLIISRKLCEAMGGDIWAASPGPGRGSSFTWYIKSTNASIPPKMKKSPYQRRMDIAAGKKVLLVEENHMVRTIVHDTLVSWGCEVYAAASELDAMNSIRVTDSADADAHVCRGPFHIIILSIAHKSLFSKLLKDRHPDEADRCIFLSWPGHVNLNEVDLPISQSNMAYVTVSRPVRQGRLQIALQEVLSLDVEELMQIKAKEHEKMMTTMTTMTTMAGGAAPLPHPHPLRPPAVGSRPSTSDNDNASSAALSTDPSAPHTNAHTNALADNASTQILNHKTLNSSPSGSLLEVPIHKNRSATSLHSNSTTHATANEDKKLLIVEDNVINMKVAIGILKRLGFQDIDTANDGLEAIDRIKDAGGPHAYHAILMDLHMPNLDGVGAVREIRSLYRDHVTPIIAVTADAFEETRDMTVSVGFSGWLAKPFRVEEFSSLMDRIQVEQSKT